MLLASSNDIEKIVIIGVKNFEFLKVYTLHIRNILIKYKEIYSQNWLSLNKYNDITLWRILYNKKSSL